MGCHASKSSAVQPYLNEKAKECPGSPVHSSSSSVRDCVSHQHMFQRKKQNLGGSKTLEDLPYVRRLESLEEFRTYYSIDSKITQGPLSIVYLVRRISDKKVFAAKLICTLKEGEKSSGKRKKAKLPFARLCAEVDIHHQMRGRYFAQLEEVFYTETRRDRGFVLVMEYADLGTLRKWARNQPDASLRFGESKGRLSSGRSFLRLPPLSEHIARRILRDVLRGVEEMHEMGIVHRDIKLDNILLKDPNPRQLVAGPSFGDERLGHGGSVAKSMGKLAQNEIVLSRTWTKKKEVPRVLIVDFGLAACSEDGQYFSFCGTTSYVAPSVINGRSQRSDMSKISHGMLRSGQTDVLDTAPIEMNQSMDFLVGSENAVCEEDDYRWNLPRGEREAYTEKCDIWSVGVVAFELLFGYHPFKGANEEETISNILARESLKLPRGGRVKVSDEAKNFVQFLLQHDERERPSASEALKHPWLDVQLEQRPDLRDGPSSSEHVHKMHASSLFEPSSQRVRSHMRKVSLSESEVPDIQES